LPSGTGRHSASVLKVVGSVMAGLCRARVACREAAAGGWSGFACGVAVAGRGWSGAGGCVAGCDGVGGADCVFACRAVGGGWVGGAVFDGEGERVAFVCDAGGREGRWGVGVGGG